MRASLTELFQAREIFLNLTARDLKIRYKRSILGVVWAVAEPLVQMSIYTVVFSYLLRIPKENYPVFVLCGILPWAFFSTGITHPLTAITANAPLVKKVYFRREVLPLAQISGRLVHFLLSFVLLFIFILASGIPVTPNVLFLPIVVFIQLMLICGIGVLLSALNTFWSDIGFLTNFALTSVFYLSPVLYPVAMVPERFQDFYLMNPMACLIMNYRRILLEGQGLDWPTLSYSALISLLVLAFGFAVFRRYDPRFAEVL